MHLGYDAYGYDCGCGYPTGVVQGASYAYPVAGVGHGNWFALIVVLFILLIIIGASCYNV